MAVVLRNKKARFDYEILETFQAGLSLSGKMVKLIRGKKIKLASTFVVYQKGRLEIIGLGNNELVENVPVLLNKREVNKIVGSIQQKGVSCVVLDIKTVGRWLKADVAVVRGKAKYDKREVIKKRDLDIEQRRGFLAN